MTRSNNKVAFIQPFGLGEAGGGARILRSLVQNAPADVVSFNSSPHPASSASPIPEFHLPSRPYFGRIERSRLAWVPSMLDPVWLFFWAKRLKVLLTDQKVTAIHVVPHIGVDFQGAQRCASELGLPINLSIHDHPDYCFKGQAGKAAKLKAVEQLWLSASNRFVISADMGKEMCRKFGLREWQIVTDGIPDGCKSEVKCGLRPFVIYFMGLFHQSYILNFRSLLDACKILMRQSPGMKVLVRLRCGSLPSGLLAQDDPVEVLPFASQDEVVCDMQSASVLYLPLPFSTDSADFVRFSLSTKMVSYLGAGRPIMIHSPGDAAAARLLVNEGAAIHIPSLSPADLATSLNQCLMDDLRLQGIASNALRLAARDFNLTAIHQRFWRAVLSLRD